MSLINNFSSHYKAIYGGPVGKIALDAGVACPNRQKGGCIYCSSRSYTPFYLEKGDSIAVQVEKGRAYLEKKKVQKYFAYFQQETTTALEFEKLAPLLEQAVSGSGCIGLIISTRPDWLPTPLLDFLAKLAGRDRHKEIILELGLQSIHDPTLEMLNRNHSADDFMEAAGRIKKHPEIQLGAHLILGLPGEDFSHMEQTVKAVVKAGVNALKFHHLQVIKDTPLENIFKEKPFTIYSAEEYFDILARLLAHVPEDVVIHRLWSSSDPDILIQPRWDIGAHEMNGILYRIMEEHGLCQGSMIKENRRITDKEF